MSDDINQTKSISSKDWIKATEDTEIFAYNHPSSGFTLESDEGEITKKKFENILKKVARPVQVRPTQEK